MTSFKKALLYGFLTWLIVFIVGFMAFVVHDSNRPLFESIMAVAATTVSMFFAVCYFKNVESNFLKEGVTLGIVFYVVNIAIDLPLFLLGGPMQTTFGAYMSDIGFTYLLFFAVTIGVGKAMALKTSTEL